MAFAFSAATKLPKRTAYAAALAAFGVPASRAIAPALPIVELTLAALLVGVPRSAWPAFLAVAVLALFTGAVVANLFGGSPKPCPCFGPPDENAQPVSAATVGRNGFLIALAILGTGSTEGASVVQALLIAAVAAPATLVAVRRFG